MRGVCFKRSSWKAIKESFVLRWVHWSVDIMGVYWCSMNHQANHQIAILDRHIWYGFSRVKARKVFSDNSHDTVYSFPRGMRVKTIRNTDKGCTFECRRQVKAKSLQVVTIPKTSILDATECVFRKNVLDNKMTILFDSVRIDGKNSLLCPRESVR